MPLGLTNVLSGNTQIDALLGTRHWDLSGGTTITYNFPGSASTTTYGDLAAYSTLIGTTFDFDWATFAPVTTSLRSAHIYAFANEFNAVTSLNYTQASDTVRADASFGMAVLGTNPETGRPFNGEAFSPAGSFPGGDAWYSVANSYTNTNAAVVDYDVVTVGNGAYLTMLHEIGHSLGLKHGHTTGGGPSGTSAAALPSNLDSHEFTIMTYRRYIGAPITPIVGDTEPNSFAQSLMMLDIQALQYLYGADFTTNSGDTTYTFSPTTGTMSVNGAASATPSGNRIFRTIWDGGGNDTYDLSNYTTGLTVDLQPGGWSTFSSAQLAQLGGWTSATPDTFAHGNVANALLYNGDTRSLIENAYGGSGSDNIEGNSAANVLVGNGGSDGLGGRAGIDVLYGGNDGDFLYGGSEGDHLYGDNGADYIYGDDGDDVFYKPTDSIGDAIYGGNGQDYINAGDGVDVIDGGAGYDVIYGGGGGDNISAGSEVDFVYGGAGFDSIYGGSEQDFLYGDVSLDLIDGGDGDDFLYGGADHDTINGRVGVDYIYGGLGRDGMDGGEGGDFFLDIATGGVPDYGAYGGAGSDYFFVSDHANPGAEYTLLVGGAGDDVFLGGAGSDYYLGEGGQNYLWTGAGPDIIRNNVLAGAGYDVVYDFTNGADQIQDEFGQTYATLVSQGRIGYDVAQNITFIFDYVGGAVKTDGGIILLNFNRANLEASDFFFG
jgi:serralysin